MQAFSTKWTPPTGVLGRIIHETSRRADTARALRPDLETRARTVTPRPDFVTSLHGSDVRIIAEVKRRSPSRGKINERLDVASHARAYQEGGAAAISILTEPEHFGGSEDDFARVRDAVDVPLLRKDFIIDEAQVIESRAWGASAVLLIARAHSSSALSSLARAAREWGIEPLIEVRTEGELDAALAAEARVIGVNTRDLETLAVSPDALERILPRIPSAILAVAESGMIGVGDVERAARAGADAVLIGSWFSESPEPASAIRSIARIARVAR